MLYTYKLYVIYVCTINLCYVYKLYIIYVHHMNRHLSPRKRYAICTNYTGYTHNKPALYVQTIRNIRTINLCYVYQLYGIYVQ